MKPDWTGLTAVVICSGPSLTYEDCEKVRDSDQKVIVTNTTYRLAPWADVVFGFDRGWWELHAAELDRFGFTGHRYCMHPKAPTAMMVHGLGWIPNCGNSGACSVALSVRFGVRKVILLGADCKKGEKAHWHEDHPAPLRNAQSVESWPAQFQKAADFAAKNGVDVVNCTRDTALTCFRRGVLEKELWTPANFAHA